MHADDAAKYHAPSNDPSTKSQEIVAADEIPHLGVVMVPECACSDVRDSPPVDPGRGSESLTDSDDEWMTPKFAPWAMDDCWSFY